MSPRFSTAVEAAAAVEVAAAAPAGVAQPLAAVREREARFLDEPLGVAPVASLVPGAARREVEIEGEPATLFVEAAGEGATE